MMMGGFGGGFSVLLFVYALLALGLVLGFSYIIWILAMKETGYVKTTGLVIGCCVAALAVILFLAGLIYGGRMTGRYGVGGAAGPGITQGKEWRNYMYNQMMRDPEAKKWLKEHMGK